MSRAALILFLIGLIGRLCCDLARGEGPINVSDRKQLFIDDRFLGESSRIELHTNPAQKLGPICDAQGNAFPFDFVSRVIDVDGKVRMYLGPERGINVLESEDGLHFRNLERPIPTQGVLATVFLDPHDPDPGKRYKLFSIVHGEPFNRDVHGVYAAYSADGFQFTEAGRVLPFFIDNPTVVHWDARIGKYVVFTRAFDYETKNQRRIARIETDDLLKPWPFTPTPHDRERLGLANVEVVLSADKDDYFTSDIYYNSSAIYSEAEDVYLMFTAQFRHFYPETHPFLPRKQPGQWEDFGPLEIQLAVSRDGHRWTRPSREPYFPTGLPDEWDRWYAVMGPGVIRRGNYLYQYYCSSGRLHDSTILREEYRHSAKTLGGIGVVRQRLDGFVSADADYKGGWIQTPPLTFDGARLRLNIDTGAMGTAFVEFRDEHGEPIPGFTLKDCEEIGGNFIDQAVYFRGNPDVSSLAGRPVQLYFELKRAKFYAFQFTP